ncbi:MAG TPA: hypothetical protein VGF28_08170 [Thermoanaerobaculia bacterium]|jgi:hypothetical protein
MNGTLAIARREVADRRVILLTAGVLALIPFAVLLIPSVKRFGSGMVIAAVGGFVALSYILALTLLLGATFIGRELADKRLSFYFAKPLAASSIWFGKLAGSLATIVLAAATILIPSMIAAAEHWTPVWRRGIGYGALVALALFLLAHTVGTMFRSRSPLLLADAACAAVAAGVLSALFNTLAAGHAQLLRYQLGGVLVALLLLFLIAGGAWQLSRGRIDPARNHRELSRFLWSAIAATLVLLGIAVFGIVSVTPADLGSQVWAGTPPAGNWMMIAGPVQHRGDYRGAFYLNVANGEYRRADARSIWWEMFFTPDGLVAGQLRPVGRGGKGPVQLELVRFGERDVDILPTQVMFSRYTQPVLTTDATRVASVANGIVRVQSLPDGRTLALARIPGAAQHARLFFDDNHRLRLFSVAGGRLDVFRLDLRSRRLQRTGTFTSTSKVLGFNATADGSRLLMRAGGELSVLDGRTAAVLAKLPGEGRGAILSDGRIAIVDAARGKLSLYGSDYTLQRELALPGMRTIPFLREVEGGKLFVGGHRGGAANEPDGRGWSVHVVDIAAGAITATGRDLRPMPQDLHFGLGTADPRRVAATADGPFIFLDADGSVVLWDPASGTKRAVTRAS